MLRYEGEQIAVQIAKSKMEPPVHGLQLRKRNTFVRKAKIRLTDRSGAMLTERFGLCFKALPRRRRVLVDLAGQCVVEWELIGQLLETCPGPSERHWYRCFLRRNKVRRLSGS